MIRRCFCAHPLTMVSFLKKFVLLLLIPLIRSAYMLLIFGEFGFSGWDIVVATIVFSLSLARCKAFNIIVENDRLTIKTGFIFKSEAIIKLDRIIVVCAESTPLSAIFGTRRVRIETEASSKKPDIELYLSKRNGDALARLIIGHDNYAKPHRSKIGEIVLFSLSSASALSGLLIWATVINYSGKLLGRRIGKDVIDSLSDKADSLERLIPQIATVVAILLFMGFIVSFLITLIRHAFYFVSLGDNSIFIKQGVILSRQTYIKRSAIGSVMALQPPAMRIFNRHSLNIGIANDSIALYPCSLDYSDRPEIKLTKHKKMIRRVIILPLWFMVLSITPLALSIIFAPDFILLGGIVLSLGVTCSLYRIWGGAQSIKNGGICFGRTVRLKDAKGLTLFDCSFDAQKIDCITLRQTPFDHRWDVVSIKVSSISSGNIKIAAKNLDFMSASNYLTHTFFR